MEPMGHDALQRAKDELFRALQYKHSLRHFLEITYDAAGLQLSLCDTSFCVLAAFPALDDEENVEIIGGKQYLRFGVTLEMEKKQHIRHLMESRHPTVSNDTNFPNPIVFQAVRINQAVVGYLFSPGRRSGFSEEELDLIEYLSQILSIEMQKNDSFAAESGIKYEYFLTELLEGRLKSDEFADERLRQLKRKVRPYYYLVQFSFDDVTSRHPSINYYYEQLLAVFPEALVGRVKGQICMLLPREGLEPLTEREELTLRKFLEFNKMRAGFSYRFTSLVLAVYVREQAEAALARPKPDQRICYYEQIYLSHLFTLVGDSDRLQALIHPDILLLHDYDQVHNSQYLVTLHTFLLNDRNAVRAAEALFIHKSTFFFRMGKIADLLGEDVMRNSGRLFNYELSFHLLDHLKAVPREGEAREDKT